MNTAGSSPSTRVGRLPAYGSSHLRRHHPYGMSSRPRSNDRLMMTVDYRSGAGELETIPEEPAAVRLKPTIITTQCEERPDTDISSLELDEPVFDATAADGAEQTRHEQAVDEKKGRFANVVLAVRRRLLALLAVAEYLNRQETK